MIILNFCLVRKQLRGYFPLGAFSVIRQEWAQSNHARVQFIHVSLFLPKLQHSCCVGPKLSLQHLKDFPVITQFLCLDCIGAKFLCYAICMVNLCTCSGMCGDTWTMFNTQSSLYDFFSTFKTAGAAENDHKIVAVHTYLDLIKTLPWQEQSDKGNICMYPCV